MKIVKARASLVWVGRVRPNLSIFRERFSNPSIFERERLNDVRANDRSSKSFKIIVKELILAMKNSFKVFFIDL